MFRKYQTTAQVYKSWYTTQDWWLDYVLKSVCFSYRQDSRYKSLR